MIFCERLMIMWERQIKNKFGGIQEVFRSEQDVDDVLSPDVIRALGYNPAGVSVKYTIVSLNKRNAEAFEKANQLGSRVDPWELNDQFITDSLGVAIHELIIRMFDPDTVHEPQLMMEIKDSNGKEAEVIADVPRTTRNTIRLMVDDAMRKRNNELEKALETYSKEIDLMREFIDKHNSKDMYNKFAEERRFSNEGN
jgi:hypothetical protein